jgi:hypothetical protein
MPVAAASTATHAGVDLVPAERLDRAEADRHEGQDQARAQRGLAALLLLVVDHRAHQLGRSAFLEHPAAQSAPR